MIEVQMLLLRPPFLPEIHEAKRTPAQKAGFRHERRVHRYFEGRYPDLYLPGPWLRYRTRLMPHWAHCQPDGLLFLPESGRILLVEAKLAHTRRAYQQLLLYQKLLSALFPAWLVVPCEVVKFFGSFQPFPVEVKIHRDPLDSQPSIFNVYVLSFHDAA